LRLLTEACATIEKNIKAVGGSFSIQMAPKVVTAIDEADLAKQMARAEMENAEVSGDDDDEEQIGMGGKIDENGEDAAAAKDGKDGSGGESGGADGEEE
jgi:translation initiation factor 2 subunit 1